MLTAPALFSGGDETIVKVLSFTQPQSFAES